MTMVPIIIGALGTIPKWLGKGAGRVENQRTRRDHPNYSIVEIGQNTEDSPGDLMRLAVTQIPVKDYRIALVWKIREESNNNNNNERKGKVKEKRLLIDMSVAIDHHHHHHHVVPPAWISLTLSRRFSLGRSSGLHFPLSFIASGRSSGLHLVSSHSCCMYVWAGRPAFARPYVGVHRSTLLMSSSLLLQQCPECLVRLTWIVFVMGGRWPYSWCLVGCCRQDFFQYCSQHSWVIAVQLLLQPFSWRPSSASIRYRYDRCLEETAFHFIGQVRFPYDR